MISDEVQERVSAKTQTRQRRRPTDCLKKGKRDRLLLCLLCCQSAGRRRRLPSPRWMLIDRLSRLCHTPTTSTSTSSSSSATATAAAATTSTTTTTTTAAATTTTLLRQLCRCRAALTVVPYGSVASEAKAGCGCQRAARRGRAGRSWRRVNERYKMAPKKTVSRTHTHCSSRRVPPARTTHVQLNATTLRCAHARFCLWLGLAGAAAATTTVTLKGICFPSFLPFFVVKEETVDFWFFFSCWH